MNILILSPYDAPSHQYWWRSLLDQFSGHNCVVVTLPARYFSWRFRGNSLTLAHDSRLQETYDLIIATSMTDLSALKGFCSNIHKVPCVLYFHENQFAYPDQGDPNHLVDRQITSLYSAITAECLVFNSEFNRETFLKGVKKLLKKLPDGVPSGIVESLQNKSRIISVPLLPLKTTVSTQKAVKQNSELVNIVWNHRWEHDKGLDELELIISKLINSDINFRFHLIGQGFRNIPQAIQDSIGLLSQKGRLGYSSYIDSRDEYLELLSFCQIVLSTARHEFQGLAVLEAIQAGCIPVVPDALAYTEFVGHKFRYANLDEALALIGVIADKPDGFYPELPPSIDIRFVSAAWEKLISELLC